MFIAGLAAKYFLSADNLPEYKNFDYSYQDSLFNKDNSNNIDNKFKKSEKKFASKPELLDFSKDKKSEQNEIKNNRSFNLNAADFNELCSLPGIGEKTAEAILNYRKSVGRFNNIDDLLNIKGIGKSKLKKIKKFLNNN